jgi:hypothetical protein
MSPPRQVGGLQEVFLETKWKSVNGLETAVRAVEKAGGRVSHAYPPAVLAAVVPADKVQSLVGRGGIVRATGDSIPEPTVKAAEHRLGFAMGLWNEHLSAERRLRMMAAPELGRAWDSAVRLPPDPPPEVLEQLRTREAELIPGGRAAMLAGAPNMTIPVLVGRIAVGLIYVDSTVAEFAITDNEKFKVTSETTEGLNMLAGFAPQANIQWFYDIRRPKISLAANQFTAANKNSWEDLWRNAAMAALGFAASTAGMATYINQIKTNNNAAWGYAIFVTKYPKFWFGYEWGNHVVMDFGVDGWGIDNFSRVVAHETGHVFGCPDEYGSSGCNCTQLGGRYQVPNGNCETCATSFVPCLMAHNTEAVCDYTRGHLGWNELAIQSRGTTTLKGTWTFDFDTGVQGPPTGADIWWEQVDNTIRFLVPQSGAMLAHMGKPNFDAVSLPTLKGLPYTVTPINGSNNAANQLTPGTVIGIKCASGRFAKMRIDSYGYNLGITWLTYK